MLVKYWELSNRKKIFSLMFLRFRILYLAILRSPVNFYEFLL